MSYIGDIFFDGSGPFGLAPDFILNMATEAGGAVLTAFFTAGLVQVANEWRKDVQRDERRRELVSRMRRDTEMFIELGEKLTKYAPIEIEALKRGELTILPPIKSAPGAINSVQLMVFAVQSAGSLAESLREFAPIVRLRRRKISHILFPRLLKNEFETALDSHSHEIDHHVASFIGELTNIERERVISMRDRARESGRYQDSEDIEGELDAIPDHFKQDVSDLRLYARELVITIWRYNKLFDRFTSIRKILDLRTTQDNFLSNYSLKEISVNGKAPRQSFDVEVNGEDFFDIYRR